MVTKVVFTYKNINTNLNQMNKKRKGKEECISYKTRTMNKYKKLKYLFLTKLKISVKNWGQVG